MKLNIRILMGLAIAAGALSLSSCGSCCTGEEPVPALRPLPSFGGANAPETFVDYAK